MNGIMVYIECMLKHGRGGHRADSESKIWRLTGSGIGVLTSKLMQWRIKDPLGTYPGIHL